MHYLDYAATAPVPGFVAEAMVRELTEDFGNPSAQYELGRKARDLVAAKKSSSPSPPAAPRGTIGPSAPLCGRTAAWAGTSSPPPWSTAPF